MTTNSSTRKQPWLAAALDIVLAGLGHLYLKEWLRAAMWISLIATVGIMTVSMYAPDAVASGGIATNPVQTVKSLMGAFTVLEFAPLLFVRLMCTIDAYRTAARKNHQQDQHDGVRCPACGREVDEDLDFCQWCTQPFTTEETESNDATATSR